MKYLGIILTAVAVLFLTACSDEPKPLTAKEKREWYCNSKDTKDFQTEVVDLLLEANSSMTILKFNHRNYRIVNYGDCVFTVYGTFEIRPSTQWFIITYRYDPVDIKYQIYFLKDWGSQDEYNNFTNWPPNWALYDYRYFNKRK
jgi:hypothetical protein